MEERSYDGLTVKNPSSVVTLELPDEGNDFYLKGKFFSLMIGVRDKELQEILADTRVVGDCLLYTSPSPRDLSTSRMPSSA